MNARNIAESAYVSLNQTALLMFYEIEEIVRKLEEEQRIILSEVKEQRKHLE